MEINRTNNNEMTIGSSSQLLTSSIEVVKRQMIVLDNHSSVAAISRSKPKLLKHTLPKIIESRDEGRNQHNFRTVNGDQAHQ